jgi:homoserine O-acetyltransferase
MTVKHRFAVLLLVGCSLTLLASPLAFAGAPAPAPVSSGPHPEHFVANLGEFRFEGGAVVKDFKVAYVTQGKLNKAKSNAILVMQPFTADHHSLDFLIGPGKALDTDKYFIVASNFIGNSLIRQDVTTGPTNSGLRMNFPWFTIRDSVNADYRLLKDYLGLDHVLAVIGPSIGAMKAYQFAVSYPTYVSGAIAVMGSPVTSPKTRWVLESMMDIVALDAGWYGGNYETNPTAGAMAALMSIIPYWYTDRWMAQNLRTPEQRQSFQTFWHGIFSIYFPQDARDLYYQMRMWATFNVGDSPGFGGDAQAALRSIKGQMLLVTAKEDLLVSADEIALAKNTIPNVTQVEIDTSFGHIASVGFDADANKVMDREIARFLARLR